MLKRICLYVVLPIFTAIGLIGALPGPTAYAQGEKYKLSSDKLTLTGSSGNFEYVFGQFSNEVKFTSLGSSGYAQNSGMLVFYYEGKPDNLGQTCGNTQGAYVEVHINTKTNKTTQVLAACGKQSEQGRTKILPEGDAYNIWDQAASVSYTAPPSGSGSNSGQSPANISGTPTYTFDESSKDGSKIKACGGFYKQFGSDCVVFSQISSSSTSAAVSKVGNGSVVLYSYNHTIPGKNQPCQAQVSLAISSTDRSLDSGSLDGWVGYMLDQGGVDITDETTANKAGCNLQRPTDKAKWEKSPGLPIKVAGADKLESFLGGSVESSGDGEKTCGSEVQGIGWIVCPITNAAIGFADMVWGIFERMLKTDPLQQSDGKDDGIYYKTWQSLRNIANVLFVVAFLIVILSQVSNIGLSNYSIKKIMPRLIIVAIAINISFLLVQISVDLANILGSTILDLFDGAIKINKDINWGGLLQEILTLGTTGAALGFGISAVASTGFTGPLIIFLLLMLIPAIVGLLAGFLALVIRSALIPIIAIFAPLALVAYIFPNGQSIFDKWRKTFTSLLLLYPLSAIYYGALKFTASIMINGQGVIERMIGHTLLFIGCFVVLGIALKGNSITGKAFGAINGGINKFIAPARKIGMGVAGGMAALKFAQFKNRDFSTTPIRRRFDPRRIADKATSGTGRMLQKFDDSQLTRKRATDFAKESATESYDDRLLAGYDPNNPNTISKMALDAAGGDRDKAKVMLDRLQATRKAENLKKSMSTLQVEYAREKAAGNSTDDFLANRALHATSDSDRDAALHMAAQTGRSTVIRKIQSDPTYAANTGLRTATQEAISANTSSLVAKAPDLVKGADPAFRSVTGEQLASFSEDTIGHYLSHIERQISAGNTAAAKSLLGAVEDIQRNPTIQAKFVDRAGLELRDKFSNSPVLSSNQDVAAAVNAIGADGKIR